MTKIEANEREEERKRNRHGDDQARSDVVEKKDQHHDHEQDAAQEIGLHGSRREPDQIAPIVKGLDLHVLRQDRAVQLVGLRLHGLENRLRLLAGAHQDDAFYGVVIVVESELPETRRTPDYDVSDILDQHWSSVVDSQHDLADVVESFQTAKPAHVIELPTLGVESAAGVPVVRAQRRGDRRNGESRPGQPRRIEHDLILHGEAAERRHVRDARDRLVLLLEDPVLDDLLFHRGPVRTLDDIAIDQSRRREER